MHTKDGWHWLCITSNSTTFKDGLGTCIVSNIVSNKMSGYHLANAWRCRSKHILQRRTAMKYPINQKTSIHFLYFPLLKHKANTEKTVIKRKKKKKRKYKYNNKYNLWYGNSKVVFFQCETFKQCFQHAFVLFDSGQKFLHTVGWWKEFRSLRAAQGWFFRHHSVMIMMMIASFCMCFPFE